MSLVTFLYNMWLKKSVCIGFFATVCVAWKVYKTTEDKNTKFVWPARVEVFLLGCGVTSSCACRRPRFAASRITSVLASDLEVGRIRGGL
jgi:hypothetical protein